MKHVILFFLLSGTSSFLTAQAVSINPTGAAPHSSAMLDVNSPNRGVLFPRMSATARMAIPSPAEGLMVWDTTHNGIWGYDGTEWREMSSLWERNSVHIQNANAGNIGIGATSSGASLYIRKPIPSIVMYDDDQPATSGTIRGDSLDLEIFAGRLLNPFTGNVPGNLILQTNENLGAFGQYVAGKVGIGTETPAYKLTLNGDMGFYSGSSFFGRIYSQASDMVVNAGFGSVFGTSADDIIMQHTFGALFSTSGRVGIGVSEPTAKLHVGSNVMIGAGDPASGYALSVNGRIMAEEMRIDDQASWPDYVFAQDYHLMPLDQLAQSIRSLGHLPGIPSAFEIAHEGLLVGDMQRRHMEKIEELTLYILELHKRIEVLEEKMTDTE